MYDCLVEFVWSGIDPGLSGNISSGRLTGLAHVSLTDLGFESEPLQRLWAGCSASLASCRLFSSRRRKMNRFKMCTTGVCVRWDLCFYENHLMGEYTT